MIAATTTWIYGTRINSAMMNAAAPMISGVI